VIEMSEPLSLDVVEELLRSVSITVTEIVLWRKKIRKLKEDLDNQDITEDDVIYSDLHNFLEKAKYEKPPISKIFSIDETNLKVTIAHRHLGESAYGVDLVYEIIDKKIALLQYKKANKGRFQIDREQTEKLMDFCYDNCIAKKIQHKFWFKEDSRIVPFCPCYYYMIIKPGDNLIMPACVVKSILDSKQKGRSSAKANEFMRGISKEAFNELFSKCWVGAIYGSKENVNLMNEMLLSENHIVIHCEEGKFNTAKEF
jgi:hypothetical protein